MLHVDIFVIKNLQFFLLHQNGVRVYCTKLLRSLLLMLSPLFQPYKPYDVQWLQSKFSSKFQYMGHENLSKWSQMGRFLNLWSKFSNYMLKRNVGRICAVSSGLKGLSCIGMILRWKNNCTYVFFVTINLTSHNKVSDLSDDLRSYAVFPATSDCLINKAMQGHWPISLRPKCIYLCIFCFCKVIIKIAVFVRAT